MDRRRQGGIRLHHKLPHSQPLAVVLGPAALYPRVHDAVGRTVRLQNPAQRLAVRAGQGNHAHRRLDAHGDPADGDMGDMLPESRRLIDEFVRKRFVADLGEGGEARVLWFKNWVALQSVRALEHFHVLVRDVDDDMLERWTGERPKKKRPWEM